MATVKTVNSIQWRKAMNITQKDSFDTFQSFCGLVCSE